MSKLNLFGLVLAMFAFGATSAAAQAADGAKVFGTYCVSCHQANGLGVEGTYPPIAGSEWVTGSPDRVVLIIMNGLMGDLEVAGEVYSGMMPPWGAALKDAEIAAVATYIRSNFGNKASPVTAAQVAALRAKHGSRAIWTPQDLVAAVK